MSRPISKQQFVELWWEEFRPDPNTAECILCGNTCRIDTRGKVFDKNGKDTGGQAWCICPNGRALKRARDADARREARA